MKDFFSEERLMPVLLGRQTRKPSLDRILCMSVNLQNKHIIIRNSYPLLAKLFGVVFIGVGGYFIWKILEALRSPVSLSNLLLIVVFALFFAIFGCYLLLASSVVVIDLGENLVLVAKDFKVYKAVTDYALSEFHTVVYDSDSKAEYPYPKVALQGDSKRVIVIFGRGHKDTQQAGQRLAVSLGFPFVRK